MVSQPVKAVLLIFPITPQTEQTRKKEDEEIKKAGPSTNIDPTVIFIEQKVSPLSLFALPRIYLLCEQISNACGTIGLLHALLNVRPLLSTRSNA